MSENPKNVVEAYILDLLTDSELESAELTKEELAAHNTPKTETALAASQEPVKTRVGERSAVQFEAANIASVTATVTRAQQALKPQRQVSITTAEQVHALEEKKRADLERLLKPALKVQPALKPVADAPVQKPPVTTINATVNATVNAPVKPLAEEPVKVAAKSKPPVTEPARTSSTVQPATKPSVEVVTAKSAPQPTAPMPPPEPPQIEESNTQAQALMPLLEWAENGRPVWAQERFDVLLFEVAGLTLAVPLIALGHIHPITEDLTPLFGQADWFMGLQPSPSGQIRCVNTALFVMPERYNPDFVKTAKYVVSIDGMDWGLAVDKVQQPTRIHPDEVTWRSQRTKRPWLAGTVKAAMCALLDVPRMGQTLQLSDPKRSKH